MIDEIKARPEFGAARLILFILAVLPLAGVLLSGV